MKKTQENKLNETSYKQGSHPQQVLKLNKRIAYLTNHLKNFRKDNIAKNSLFKLVSKKKRFLKYLSKKEPEIYRSLIKKV